MSAYEVSQETIHVLVNAGLQFGERSGAYALRWYFGNPLRSEQLDHETAERTGAMLVAENRRSVNYRYDEDEIEQPYQFQRIDRRLDPVRVLKVLACYEYQACESDDWRETEAHWFCRYLQSYLIYALPGYEAGPRDVDDVAQCYADPTKVG